MKKSTALGHPINYKGILLYDLEAQFHPKFPSKYFPSIEWTVDHYKLLTTPSIHPSHPNSLLSGHANIQFSQRPGEKNFPPKKQHGVTSKSSNLCKMISDIPLKNEHHLKRNHDSKGKDPLPVPAFLRGYSIYSLVVRGSRFWAGK